MRRCRCTGGTAAHPRDQACNGLRLWAENFSRLVVMMPLAEGPPPPSWVPLARVGAALERIEIVPLPQAYRPDRFVARLPAVRRQLRALIARADYLSFAIGGLFGDWGRSPASRRTGCGRPLRGLDRPGGVRGRRRSAASGPLPAAACGRGSPTGRWPGWSGR